MRDQKIPEAQFPDVEIEQVVLKDFTPLYSDLNPITKIVAFPLLAEARLPQFGVVPILKLKQRKGMHNSKYIVATTQTFQNIRNFKQWLCQF